MNYIDFFREGSGIHIKKSHRGLFTKYCNGKVTEECILRGKHSSDPKVRKRATFAYNARHKFHHDEGGILKASDGAKTYYNASRTILPDYIHMEYPTDLSVYSMQPTIYNEELKINYPVHGIVPTETKRDVVKLNSAGLSDTLSLLIKMFDEEGIDIKVTSGFRKGAKTKLGNISKHGLGEAIDIVPLNGDFNDLDSKIKSNKRIRDFMMSHGYGVIREDNDEMLKKTGGTGYHFHIGTDKLALKYWQS